MTNDKLPLVSIITAVFNGEKYIAESIKSVLTQNYQNFELIIVNDGSWDNTLEQINQFEDSRIKLINQENQGPAAARNNGISEANGKYIAILDSDDLFKPTKLEKQVEFLNASNDFVAVGSFAEVIDENGEFVFVLEKETNSTVLANDISIRSPFIHSSVLFKKEIFLKAGMYPDIPPVEDRFLFAKMAQYGQLMNLTSPELSYRLNPKGISMNNHSFKGDINIALQAYLESGELKRHLIQYDPDKTSEHSYNILLAKKYLLNNFRPSKSRIYSLKNLRKRVDKLSLILYASSFLPYWLLNLFKKRRY